MIKKIIFALILCCLIVSCGKKGDPKYKAFEFKNIDINKIWWNILTKDLKLRRLTFRILQEDIVVVNLVNKTDETLLKTGVV